MMRQFRSLLLATLLLSLFEGALSAEMAPHALVLVGSKTGNLSPLSQTELRRLYLGKPVERKGAPLVALRNTTDPLLYETFLQKVVFMSAQNYQRFLLTQVYRFGGRTPPEYSDLDALHDALRRDPARITFMWRADAEALGDVAVIQELWLEPAP